MIRPTQPRRVLRRVSATMLSVNLLFSLLSGVFFPSVSYAAEGINPVAIVDARVDKIREMLRELIGQSEAAGNRLVQEWARQTLIMLDRIDESMTEQQKLFWTNAGDQREKLFIDLERMIS